MPTGIYISKNRKNVFKKGHPQLNSGKTCFKKGHKPSDKAVEKLRLRLTINNPMLSKESRDKISKTLMGHSVSEETRKKLSKALIGRLAGCKNPSWQGGRSFEPYSVDWTLTLKKSIRERDKYTCQMCGKEPSLCCHHIDYDKKNCNPNNLIVLCRTCHNKTNNNRNYWINYFLKTK